MPLNPTTANALGEAIASALNVTDADAKAKWKAIANELYDALLADLTVTILAGSIVTTGSAATQSGPAAPIPLSPD